MVHTVDNIWMYLPDMLLKVLSVLKDISGLLLSPLVTVADPAEDGEVLNAGSLMLPCVTLRLPAQPHPAVPAVFALHPGQAAQVAPAARHLHLLLALSSVAQPAVNTTVTTCISNIRTEIQIKTLHAS